MRGHRGCPGGRRQCRDLGAARSAGKRRRRDRGAADSSERLHDRRRRREHHRAVRRRRRRRRRRGRRLQQADAVVAAIRKLTTQPIRYVIDTSVDADHVGGNEKVAKAGQTLFQTNNPLGEGMTNGGAAAILSAEKVLTRMSAPTGQGVAVSDGDVADRDVRPEAQVHVPERRGHRGAASAGGAHRRRQRRVLPPIGRRRGRRHPRHDAVSGDRRRARRQHPGRNRRAQPARRARDSVRSARLAGRRHATSFPVTAASAISSTSSSTATW